MAGERERRRAYGRVLRALRDKWEGAQFTDG